MTELNKMICDRYKNKYVKKKFSVSMQHYSFALKAFVETVKQVGMEEYEFAAYETRTYEVIDAVKTFKSELGIIYINDFNSRVITKLLGENSLEFIPLFDCDTYVYLWSGHPLAKNKTISMLQLQDYPCLSFDQGQNNSFYLAEEVKSTYEYRRIIKANDRATMLNLMIGLNGFTLCSGIICSELNGDDYCAVPLEENEKMTIGYIKRKGSSISPIAEIYIDELKKYAKAL